MAGGYVHNIDPVRIGVAVLVRSRLRRLGRLKSAARMPVPLAPANDTAPHWAQPVAFAVLLACCLTIPSNWTQNIPVRYGARHPGLTHSWFYPDISWTPPPATPVRRWLRVRVPRDGPRQARWPAAAFQADLAAVIL